MITARGEIVGTLDNTHSSYREMVLRHIFIGELLRVLWRQGRHAEVLNPHTDDSGYDVAIECNGVLRHIQLKATKRTGKARRQDINTRLATKPSGCVVWLFFDDDVAFTHFLWLGGSPGAKLPDLGSRVAKHKKGNAQGLKLPRPGIRVVPAGQFTKVASIGDLVVNLFGPPS
jgi:hypothetical protein